MIASISIFLTLCKAFTENVKVSSISMVSKLAREIDERKTFGYRQVIKPSFGFAHFFNKMQWIWAFNLFEKSFYAFFLFLRASDTEKFHIIFYYIIDWFCWVSNDAKLFWRSKIYKVECPWARISTNKTKNPNSHTFTCKLFAKQA